MRRMSLIGMRRMSLIVPDRGSGDRAVALRRPSGARRPRVQGISADAHRGGGGHRAKLWSPVLAGSCLVVLWVAFVFKLIALTANY